MDFFSELKKNVEKKKKKQARKYVKKLANEKQTIRKHPGMENAF